MTSAISQDIKPSGNKILSYKIYIALLSIILSNKLTLYILFMNIKKNKKTHAEYSM